MLAGNPKIISVVFYAAAGGGEPLVRAMVGYDRLWEVRISLSGNRIARVMFTVHNNRMILLHGFIKKSKTTPNADLVLADKRKRDIQRGN